MEPEEAPQINSLLFAEMRLLRSDIDAVDNHIYYLKSIKASDVEIAQSVDEKRRRVERLDKMIGYR
jgi:hypothetical protein